MTAWHAELITTDGHAKVITTAWRANCLHQLGMTILVCFVLFVMIAMVTSFEFGDLCLGFVVLGVDLLDLGCLFW